MKDWARQGRAGQGRAGQAWSGWVAHCACAQHAALQCQQATSPTTPTTPTTTHQPPPLSSERGEGCSCARSARCLDYRWCFQPATQHHVVHYWDGWPALACCSPLLLMKPVLEPHSETVVVRHSLPSWGFALRVQPSQPPTRVGRADAAGIESVPGRYRLYGFICCERAPPAVPRREYPVCVGAGH